MPSEYGLSKKISLSHDLAIDAITASLKEVGFGILTTIDVKATMKKKLDVDVQPYTILGACNPSIAYQALQAEPDLGLLLPCNVIVYDNQDETSTIAVIDPQQMMQFANNPALEPLGNEARTKLESALAAVE